MAAGEFRRVLDSTGGSLVDRSGYCQRQRGDGELLAPAWRKTVINRRMAAVLYSTADGVGLAGSRLIPPFFR